jgi:UDP-glucose 4-epimerase
MRVLLTGASGFLGKAWSLAADPGIEIVALGRSVPEEIAGRVRLIEADLSEPAGVARAVASGALPEAVDAVVHLAVSRHHRQFPERALDMFEVNVAATAQLLDYAKRAGARHFVLGSTGTVYSPGDGGRLDEARQVYPEAFFAVTKRAAELLAESYRPHFAVGILRFFVPYGPGQTDRLVPDLIARVERGDAVTLPPVGDGMAFTPIYIDDAVRVLETCLTEKWNDIVNVSADEPLTICDAARIIGEIVGRAPRFERSVSASSLQLVPDLTRLGRRVPIDEFTRFGDGVRRMLSS